MIKNEAVTGVLLKIAVSVAVAGTLGGAGAVIKNTSDIAVHNQRLSSLERNAEQMEELSDKLDETNKNVAILNERLNQERSR